MGGERILVIDDSKEIVRHLTKQVLPTFGFEALSASDGATGLKMIRGERPDLVMLDLNLPEMNGLDVLHALARESVSTPVILMTGYGSEKDAIEAFRLGIRDYLVKPFTVDEVIETINKVLEQEKQRSGNSERLAEDVRRLKTDISRLVNETNTLFSIGKAVASLLDVNKVVERVLDAAIYLTNAEESTIWVHDRDSNELRAFAKKGHDKKLLPVNLDKKDSIAAEVLREGHPIRKMAFSGGGIKIQTGFLARAVLYVPLAVRGVIIGVLSVSNLRAPRPFTERHEFLLTVLADYAAIALENSRAFQATDKALTIGMDELKTLNQITRTIISHIDLKEVVQMTIKQIHESWKVHAASIWLYDETRQTTRILTNFGTADEDILSRFEVPVGKGFVGHVIRTGKWIYTNEVDEHPLHYKAIDMETGFTTRSLLCVPLIFRDKVVGALQLINKLDGKFNEPDVERARSIGSAVAIAISNAQLFERAETRQKQLEATLENIGLPTVLVDREDRLLLINRQARELLRVETTVLGHLAQQIIKNQPVVEILKQPVSSTPIRRPVQMTDGREWMYTLAEIPGQGGRILILQDTSQMDHKHQDILVALSNDLRGPVKVLYQGVKTLQRNATPEQEETVRQMVEAMGGLERVLRQIMQQPARVNASPN